MKSRWLAYVLLGSVSFGFACKGNGDGGTSVLEIVETAPQNGQEDVIVDTPVAVRVNALIDPDTLTTDTFFLTDETGALVPSSVKILDEPNADPAQMGTAAELIPEESLAVLTNFTVTVTTGLESTGGASLEKDFQWTFQTLDAAWGDAEWIEPLGTWTSRRQEIAVDGQLNAFAVWELDDGSNTFIYANRYTRRLTWGEPEPIDDGNGRAVRPMVAADGPGNGFAVWEQADIVTGTADQRIWTNRYDLEEERWGTAELLQNGDITRARIPSVAADPSGNATAVWVQVNLDTGQEIVRALRYAPGTGWGDAVTIGSPDTNVAASITDVGMDDQGAAIAVWNPAAGGVGGRVIWANRYTPGLGWGEVAVIKPDETTTANDVRLDVGANGDAFVIWRQNSEAEPRDDIWAARFSGGVWSAPQRIDIQDAGDKSGPDIAVDGAGTAYAVWAQLGDEGDELLENIWAAEYAPGSGWGIPVLIEPKNEDPTEDGPATTPRVEVNRGGNVFVVWRQIWDQWGSIWSNRRDPGNSWVPADAERIEDFPDPASLPKIVVDEKRHAHSVWLHMNAGSQKVRTNRFE